MKFVPECVECSVRQADRTFSLAMKRKGLEWPGLSAEPNLEEEVRAVLSRVPEHVSPAEVSYYAIEWAMQKTGDHDPYEELKHESNALALDLDDTLIKMVASSKDPLKTALLLSVAGNVIDLGIQKEYNIEETLRHAMEKGFALDQTEELRDELSKVRNLLYCCDNSGEIVFDRILIETLLDTNPGLLITAVVKGGAVLNDALIEDARLVGLDRVCEVIETGNNKLGMVVEDLSDECRQAYRSADLIISKGQANYESLEHRPENIFCILMAKCEIVAAHLGIPYKAMALTRGSGWRKGK